MCKYEYKTPFAAAEYKICVLQEQFFNIDILDLKTEYCLPLDSEGYCLFHSKDGIFKATNGFAVALERYLDYCQVNKEYKFVDLRGVVLSGMHDFVLKDKTYTKQINFSDAEFVAPFRIETSHLHGDLFLDQCIFHNICEISDSSFSGSFTAIGGAAFNKNVSFKEVKFEGLFDVADANFMSQVNFIDVGFNDFTRFDNTGFNAKDTFSFIVHFNADTHFNGTRFEGQVQFEDCSFNGEVQFVGTKFNDHTYVPRPTIKGTLLFKGSDEAHRIFNTSIEMAISEDSFVDAGQIIFEHANLIHLDSKTKSQLRQLQLSKQIVLSGSTEVFRFYFKERYLYSQLDEVFINQLLNTIKQYFDQKLSKHFEFVMSQEGDDLVVTFYTDDYVRQEDFKVAQEEAVNDMVKAVDNPASDGLTKYLGLTINDHFNRGEQLQKENLIQGEAKYVLMRPEQLVVNLFSGSSIGLLKADTININKLQQATIQAQIIKLENDAELNLSDSMFEELKEKISTLSISEFSLIKEDLAAIKNNTADKVPSFRKEVQEFLMQKGINVGDGLISRAVYELLMRILFGGGV